MRQNGHASVPDHGYLGRDWGNCGDWHEKPLANPVDTGLCSHSDARSADHSDDRYGDRCGMDWPHLKLDAGKAAGSAVELV